MNFITETKFIDFNRSTEFDQDIYYKLYYKSYNQIKKAALAEIKSQLNTISIIEPKFKTAKTIFETNLRSSYNSINAIINLIE